jgi:energy-coupling factor transporter ATP-binding protein EcfA2
MAVVILIGASGSGKTTIAKAIQSRHEDEFDVYHFDQIGVPSVEQMIADYGSGEMWQRAKTIEWMAKLGDGTARGRRVLFEGQTRLSFLADGAAAAGSFAFTPILIDCDDETRTSRLSLNRGQAELANAAMMNWATWLRRDASERGCEILDTSVSSLEESVAQVLRRLREHKKPWR